LTSVETAKRAAVPGSELLEALFVMRIRGIMVLGRPGRRCEAGDGGPRAQGTTWPADDRGRTSCDACAARCGTEDADGGHGEDAQSGEGVVMVRLVVVCVDFPRWFDLFPSRW
jgi:hypothetical protein